MKNDNISLKNADSKTAERIYEDTPPDWDRDALFESAYGKFLTSAQAEPDDAVDLDGEVYPVEEAPKQNRITVIIFRIMTAAACIALAFIGLRSLIFIKPDIEPPDEVSTPVITQTVTTTAVTDSITTASAQTTVSTITAASSASSTAPMSTAVTVTVTTSAAETSRNTSPAPTTAHAETTAPQPTSQTDENRVTMSTQPPETSLTTQTSVGKPILIDPITTTTTRPPAIDAPQFIPEEYPPDKDDPNGYFDFENTGQTNGNGQYSGCQLSYNRNNTETVYERDHTLDLPYYKIELNSSDIFGTTYKVYSTYDEDDYYLLTVKPYEYFRVSYNTRYPLTTRYYQINGRPAIYCEVGIENNVVGTIHWDDGCLICTITGYKDRLATMFVIANHFN